MSTLALSAQVERSTKFIHLFGTKYYLHTVKKGETLNQISKAYNVTVSEISLQNKGVVDNIHEGSILKIPVIAENSTPAYTQQFVYHNVEKKESLYSICKLFGCSQEDIIKYNPEVKQGLQAGMTLKIPVLNDKNPDKIDTEFIYHTIKQNETLSSMSNFYGVSIDQIVKYNPKLKIEIKAGTIARIPKIKSLDNNLDDNQAIELETVLDQAKQQEDYCPCQTYIYKPSTTFKIALMLPLYINDNYQKSIDMRSDPNKVSLYKTSENIYEFYQGVLLAAKEYQQLGKSFEINVYDTERNSSKTQSILRESKLKTMDLIIGPLYTENVKLAATFAKENKIALVSPFAMNKDILLNNPYVFQYTASNATQITKTAEYFASIADGQVVIIHNNNSQELEEIRHFKENLSRSYFSNKNVPQMNLKEIDYSVVGNNGVTQALSTNKKNIVLITSTDEVFITKVVNQLASMTKTQNYDIILFGDQSWEKFSNLDTEFLQSMNFHYRSTSYTDYSNPKIKDFVSKYYQTFNNDPSVYAFKGYDVAKYFFGMLIKHGKYFEFCINKKESGLNSEFDFERINEESGFENQAVNVLKYNSEFKLEKRN